MSSFVRVLQVSVRSSSYQDLESLSKILKMVKTNVTFEVFADFIDFTDLLLGNHGDECAVMRTNLYLGSGNFMIFLPKSDGTPRRDSLLI